jgi:hypothetical protein
VAKPPVTHVQQASTNRVKNKETANNVREGNTKTKQAKIGANLVNPVNTRISCNKLTV